MIAEGLEELGNAAVRIGARRAARRARAAAEEEAADDFDALTGSAGTPYASVHPAAASAPPPSSGAVRSGAAPLQPHPRVASD
jgi:hypothetical protein